ncbi:hypothetical protein [Streptomyces sp. NPDC004629]|uniref:hypothetical protein n=1 Tax=Streptomyces sp. NPDC004629 TaxID=3364705 RepID=UPI0036A77168
MVGLALLLFGLARGGERGDVGAPGTLVPALTGVLLAAVFVRRALTAREPLLGFRVAYSVAAGLLALALLPAFLLPACWPQP